MPRMTPVETLVETFVTEGVDTVFARPGPELLDIMDLLPSAGIRFVATLTDQVAVHAADGLARVTGRPQVCLAQTGPGVADLASALAGARRAHSPLVVVTPAVDSAVRGTTAYQEIDQVALLSECTAYRVHLSRADRIAEAATRCFAVAKSELAPAHLDVPVDLLRGDVTCELVASPRIHRGPGGDAELDLAAQLLGRASFPVILAGGGVVQSDAVQEVVALAEWLTAPVVNGYLHNDSFPWAHPLAVGPLGHGGSKAAMSVLAQADVVLALGTRMSDAATGPAYDVDAWPRDAAVVQVDQDPWALQGTPQVDLAVTADARAFAIEVLSRLREAHEDRRPRQSRLELVAEVRERWEAELTTWAESEAQGMHPRAFLRALSVALPDDAVVAVDSGAACSLAHAVLGGKAPRSFLGTGTWGRQGSAYGLALGAKVGVPSRPVVALQGDGAWSVGGLASVMTALAEDLAVIAIVLNDGRRGAEQRIQEEIYGGRVIGTSLERPDWALIAGDMGAVGFTVESADEVLDVVDAALGAERPVVIDALIASKAGFLAEPRGRASIARPRRVLAKYRHLASGDTPPPSRPDDDAADADAISDEP